MEKVLDMGLRYIHEVLRERFRVSTIIKTLFSIIILKVE